VLDAVGIDVSASAFHLIGVAAGEVVVGSVLDDVEDVVAACTGAARIAIDAPGAPARGVHAEEPGRPAKVRAGRCGEVAAAEQLGVWVPWVTQAAGRCPPWMESGFALWVALAQAGHAPIEVYPAGSVWLQARRWPPKKTTVAGLTARRALLEAHLRLPPFAELWSHDAVDATIAAAVAAQGEGALCATHAEAGCDGSAIWFLRPEACATTAATTGAGP
jgi:predicted nuclease with RNAse H fold